ncbi:MAG TPA: exosortase system-associated protein, TIGR04073 family [Candidatus Hydrogenedentes bacterium]|nr:exosortase system-associated protein, TIGR04073 family [Candidatus Hydrogenedentota bacterium]HOK91116.1 exosortase system-associated protein, TIGR04073 family [Candidatus Hydrogenedentota bacterium]HOV60230.1 exosortase system-associated protein, TIGR04073 family [Candidatus Hydrogenedentota bacterium]
MKRAKSGLVMLAALVVTVWVVLPVAQAQTYDPDVDLPKPTALEKTLTKLGRGLSNIVLGWAEIPVTFDRSVKKGKPLGYLVGVAPVMGTARAVMRTGTGFYEAVTFPVTDKAVNYEAVLEPEYIF